MTSEQFVSWFKGFVQAANTYNITPKQWDTICEYLEKVKDLNHEGGYLLSNKPGRYGTTTTTAERRGDVTYGNDTPTTKTLLTDNIF
jgi:hypothetical protein